jgi:hypothetical protein
MAKFRNYNVYLAAEGREAKYEKAIEEYDVSALCGNCDCNCDTSVGNIPANILVCSKCLFDWSRRINRLGLHPKRPITFKRWCDKEIKKNGFK